MPLVAMDVTLIDKLADVSKEIDAILSTEGNEDRTSEYVGHGTLAHWKVVIEECERQMSNAANALLRPGF